MAQTEQQKYHAAVAKVRGGVEDERNAMGGAKSTVEVHRERIAGVQSNWANFVTSLAATRASHTEFMGALGAAADHHSKDVTGAQGAVNEKHKTTVDLYGSLIADIRHTSIQQFAQILGALGESIKDENGVVAKLGENYNQMTGEAARRETALSELQVAGAAYKENRLDPQQGIVNAMPEHYDTQMGGATQGIQALNNYVATT